MAVTAEAVKALRERTGAGMMECKKALVEANGDLEAAAEAMRKSGLAKADKKAGRIAAEGVIAVERSADGLAVAVVEVNSETDFVAREKDFLAFAAAVAKARARVAGRRTSTALLAVEAALRADGRGDAPRAHRPHRREHRRAPLRDRDRDRSARDLPARQPHRHRGGDRGRRRRRSATTSPCTWRRSTRSSSSAEDVPADQVEKEREIFIAQAATDPKLQGKPKEVLVKATEGKLRKYLGEITLLGQPFVKDDKQTVAQVLKQANARVVRFVRYEVGRRHREEAGELRRRSDGPGPGRLNPPVRPLQTPGTPRERGSL